MLAAGASTRMGRPKALLPWGRAPLVRHQANVLRARPEIARLVVVLGHRAADAAAALDGADVRTVVNPDYRQGRATSLAAGARALADGPAASVIVVNVDQPLDAQVLCALLDAWRASPRALLRPTWQGRSGHPLVVPADLTPELRAVDDAAQGLRAVVMRHRARLRSVPVESALAAANLNTPEAFAAAAARHAPTV